MPSQPLSLHSLSLEQKLGLMLVGRNPGNDASLGHILRMVENRSLGALHLVPHSPYKNRILAAADYPLLILDNMESGFPTAQAVPLPSPSAVGATNREDYAYEHAKITAMDAKAQGFNGAFGPVFDIGNVSEASCICGRSLGSDPAQVARLAVQMVRGYQDAGMVVTAKHYPGFGASHVDSHLGMVTIHADRETLLRRELAPYLAAIREADLSGIMTGHIRVPAIDPDLPASLSPALIELIREHGFQGIIMTDSLAMMGLSTSYELEESHKLALAAGNDLIMPSYRVDTPTALRWMREALHDGLLTEAAVDAAAARVIAAQNKTLKPANGFDEAARAEAVVLGRTMARESITAHLEPSTTPAVDTDTPCLVVLQEGNTFVPVGHPILAQADKGSPASVNEMNEEIGALESETNPTSRISRWMAVQREVGTADAMAARILEEFPLAQVRIVPDFPSYKDIEQTLVEAVDYPRVIFVLYARTREYTGSADLSERLCSLVEALAPKTDAVLLIGNHWAVRRLPRVKRLLVAYGFGMVPPDGRLLVNEEAVLDVLTGRASGHGSLPAGCIPFSERPQG